MKRRDFITLLGGAAVVWPLAARAQQRAIPAIGFLDSFGPRPNSPFIEAFRAGLADGGFIEGKDLSIEYRSANGDFRLLPSLAADLVHRKVVVIVAVGALAAASVAKAATSTIPIVFYYYSDPVKDGLVTSLSRPGGNVTGMTLLSRYLLGKRLDLLLQMVPQAKKVGFLSGDRSFGFYEEQTTSVLSAGRALGVEIMIVECRSDRDYGAALTKMVEGGADAMILGTFALPNLGDVVPLAALHRLPAMYPSWGFVQDGGLMSYEADERGLPRRMGSAYVARILKGMKPGDLPVEQPTKFELVINLWAAKAIGLRVPDRILAVADEVIEYERPRGQGWKLVPTISVVSAAADPRLALVRDAIAFWNETFAELGTPFRLGAVTEVVETIPVKDLRTVDDANFAGLPESLKRIEGNIVVVLSEDNFISFGARWVALNKAVVAIKDYHSFPLTLPNVARNLIAQLLGFAIGLSNNADPTTLMCGRPAPCRPDRYASDHPNYLPLTEAEKADLLRMYPMSWQASR
jgi:putative ABC transport system substrate-binding protein